MGKLIISKAKKEDIEFCYELSKVRELLTAGGTPVPLDYFKDSQKHSLFLVAKINDKVVGYTIGDLLKTNLAVWWLLSVDPNHQNKGIGKKLFIEFEKACKKKKVRYIVGYAPKFNKKTLDFHKSNGFYLGKEDLTEIQKDI